MINTRLQRTSFTFCTSLLTSLAFFLFSCDHKQPIHLAEPSEILNDQGMVWIAGGEFVMGTDEEEAYPAEKPAVKRQVKGFWMDQTEVTNQQYKEFVDA